MSFSSSSERSLANWLTKLNVFPYSPTTNLYPNGHQQVALRIEVEPRPGNQVSEAELSSLRLMMRNSQGQLVPLGGTPSAQGWAASPEQDNDYEYLPPAAAAAGEGGAPSTVFQRYRYVTNNSQRGGNSVELFVGITRQTEEGPQDYFTDGSSPGFTASVVVSTVAPPRLSLDDFVFEPRQVSGHPNSDIQVVEYQLGIQYLALHSLVSAIPAGMIQWVDRDPGVTRATLVGHALPGHPELIYNRAIVLGGFVPRTHASQAPAGRLVLSLQSDNRIPYHSASALNHGGPLSVTVRDVHGNEHRLGIRFRDQTPPGRFFLELSLG